MAIRPIDEYSGKVATPTADYPDGKAQNITSPGDGTGTPWEANLVNDIFGFQQYLTNAAGITPSGTPESATTSQYFEAIWKLLNIRPVTINVASDADLTLTAAQNLYAKVTVTDTGVILTTGRNVIVDNVGRIFIFTNSTAQTLTVKTAAGTGVAIPTGTSSLLINDGTDVTLLTTATPTADYELANKKYVDDNAGVTFASIAEAQTGTETTKVINPDTLHAAMLAGVDQTWQDVKASRAIGVTYTNTTGRPIVLAITSSAAGGSSDVFINGVRVYDMDNRSGVSLIIPNGDTYLVSTNLPDIWFELR